MATKKAPKVSPASKLRAAMGREARAAYSEIDKGVKGLGKSIDEIKRGLIRAEKKIEADAKLRIRDLRKEANAQLKTLQGSQREAARTLKSLSAAAGESWQEIKISADGILSDARTTAASVVEKFRKALG